MARSRVSGIHHARQYFDFTTFFQNAGKSYSAGGELLWQEDLAPFFGAVCAAESMEISTNNDRSIFRRKPVPVRINLQGR